MGQPDLNSTERFSNRVGDYAKYRPSYPAALIGTLCEITGLGAGRIAADVGSGTGIFTRLLLETGARIYAVEPNAPMRAAAESDLGSLPGFVSISGTAEATGLPDQYVSVVACAQAFHWFDIPPTRREFLRILAPKGWCAIVWNAAAPETSEFSAGYETIKAEFGTDYERVQHETRKGPDRFDAFFGHRGWKKHLFENSQQFDFEGLKGRFNSSSYAPPPGHPGYEPALAALRKLYDRCQVDGSVRMDYRTELFTGRME